MHNIFNISKILTFIEMSIVMIKYKLIIVVHKLLSSHLVLSKTLSQIRGSHELDTMKFLF
jgi:hypothetical protein